MPGEGKVSLEEFLLVIRSQTRVARIRAPPRTIKATPPRIEILPGASRPNLIFSDIALEGCENPSWAHRKGRISSSGKFLKYFFKIILFDLAYKSFMNNKLRFVYN